MEIKKAKSEVTFGKLKFGDVFTYEGSYFMKTREINTNIGFLMNSVVLDNGDPCSFSEDEMVSIVKGKFVEEE